MLRGDSGRQHTLELAGIERAKAVVVADDDPATAQRIVAVARSLAPTARIIVRTRYPADATALEREGADRVVVDELESVVQLFADVLRNYRISPQEIEAHEAAIRSGGYAALRELSDEPVVVCDLDGRCLDTRTVVIRDGAPLVGQSLRIADVDRRSGGDRRRARPDALDLDGPVQFLPGDVVTLAGSAEAFAAAATAVQGGRADAGGSGPAGAARPDIDVDSVITFTPHPQGPCTHLDRIVPVHRARAGARSACAAAIGGCTCASA